MQIYRTYHLIIILTLLTGCQNNNNYNVLEKKKTFKNVLNLLKAGDTTNTKNNLISIPSGKMRSYFESNFNNSYELLRGSQPTLLDSITITDSGLIVTNNTWHYTYSSNIYKNDSFKGSIIMTFYGPVNDKITDFYPELNMDYSDLQIDTTELDIR